MTATTLPVLAARIDTVIAARAPWSAIVRRG